MNRDDEALFKYSIVAPFINGTSGCSSVRDFCREASTKQYFHNGKNEKFKEETIRKWVSAYRKNGYDGLKRKVREDNNKPRTLDEDLLIRIEDLKIKFPRMRVTTLYTKLISEGYFDENEISVRTFQRFIKTRNYLKKSSEYERKSFNFEFPNDSWQTDTTHGPYIVIKGKKYKTYIIVFIDDHSRMVVGAKAYFRDTALNMQELLKESIRKYGVPKQIYADNGGPYSNKQLSIICARIGVQLKNAKPYDPESKGKVERFNRTLKDRWMNGMDWNKIEDIDDLNEKLDEFVRLYNNTEHKSIKKTPNKCYFDDSKDIRYLDEKELEKNFYHSVIRKVDNVGNVKIENRIYEVDYGLKGQKVEFTYNPEDTSKIYYGEQTFYLLNRISNSKRRRKKNVDYSKMVNKENEELLEYEGE